MFVLHPLRVLAFKADLSQQNLPEIHDAAFRHCRKIEGFACSPCNIEYRKTKGSNTRCQSDKYGNSYKCFYSDHPTSFLWQTRTNTYIISFSMGYLANTHLSSLTKKHLAYFLGMSVLARQVKQGCFTCASKMRSSRQCLGRNILFIIIKRAMLICTLMYFSKVCNLEAACFSNKLNECHMECKHMSL